MLLAQVSGQPQATTVLTRALDTGRVAHAYLFDGPEGIGKRTTALALGLALVCGASPGVGCGTCDACRRAIDGNHPDVRIFDAATLKEQAKAAGQDNQTKFVRESVFPYALQRPHEAPARLFIVDHADELGVQAQNAFLKTLEEPRSGIHIVLVSSAPTNLLSTIRSRTQRLRFLPLRPESVIALLMDRGIDKASAEVAAALSGGLVGRALSLVQGEDQNALWEAVAKLRRAAGEGGLNDLFKTAAELGSADAKDILPDTLGLLARLYRDALVAAVGADDLVLLRERADEIDALAAKATASPLGPLRLRKTLRGVVDAQSALDSNVNAVSALERLLIHMRATERKKAA